jgi:E3 ubiquitin-protein ligase DMA1/2
MLMGSSYPQFTCPNCRAVTDLEAELDADDGEEWEKPAEESAPSAGRTAVSVPQPPNPLQNQEDTVHAGGAAAAYDQPDHVDLGDVDLTNIHFEANPDLTTTNPQPTTNGLLSRRQTSNSTTPSQIAPVNSIEIPRSANAPQLAQVMTSDTTGTLHAATPNSADIIAGEGPLTPRNNAGPFVFDGSAGRASGRLLTASAMDESE